MQTSPYPYYIECSHQKHIIFSAFIVLKFPIKRYQKKLKRKGIPLTEPLLLKLADYFGVGHPVGFTRVHHCEKVTAYQNKAKFIYVKKV